MKKTSNDNERRLRSGIRVGILSMAAITLAWLFLAEQSPYSVRAFEQTDRSITVPIQADLSETELEQQMALDAERSPRMFEYHAEKRSDKFEPFSFGAIKPLFVGVDDVSVPAFLIDPADVSTAQAFIGAQVWGAAYDSANARVFFNNGSTLYEWPVGGTFNLLGPIVDGGGAVQALVGLAWHNGELYGIKNIATEGIWQINTTTRVATLLFTYPSTHDMGGFAVDPSSGSFYATDDNTRALVRINLNGTVTSIAPYPAGQTDLDGLAISNDGRAFLVPDEPGLIYVYDLVGGTYLSPILNPWTTAEVFSGATWINAMAATATISGRAVTDSGIAIGKVFVQITDGASYNAVALTNPFGHFVFEGVPTGATYTITGTAKQYTFVPFIVSVTSDVTGIELIADPN